MGQLGSNLGNANITDPRQARPQDLDASEMGARMIAQGTRGLAQGFQNYQNQNSMMRQGGGQMMQSPQAQMVSPDFFQPQRRGPNNLSFYGDSNG